MGPKYSQAHNEVVRYILSVIFGINIFLSL